MFRFFFFLSCSAYAIKQSIVTYPLCLYGNFAMVLLLEFLRLPLVALYKAISFLIYFFFNFFYYGLFYQTFEKTFCFWSIIFFKVKFFFIGVLRGFFSPNYFSAEFDSCGDSAIFTDFVNIAESPYTQLFLYVNIMFILIFFYIIYSLFTLLKLESKFLVKGVVECGPNNRRPTIIVILI